MFKRTVSAVAFAALATAASCGAGVPAQAAPLTAEEKANISQTCNGVADVAVLSVRARDSGVTLAETQADIERTFAGVARPLVDLMKGNAALIYSSPAFKGASPDDAREPAYGACVKSLSGALTK
ncbi:hypothetical protein H1O16_gp060 [Burkholderia phage BcepSaruman]|uniref:Lipoprotein n=1 Tax=Burkholderia phage BcepSaruman TaxID=2530032 RepID=A0A4D5ZBU5_9CAUD|nr:hypothetical protein H1O16_gp060 [Burkholderia phage BcepSaruman]QBX06473.1 hypothetical protein BcepSaruman_060 [Burkholderia phage BcepSaruman]